METSINQTSAPDLASYLRESFGLPQADLRSYSPLTLAYIGDDVFDLIMRTMLVERGNAPVNQLNKKASKLVNAVTQCKMMAVIEPMLTEEEHGVFKRGRNAKSYTSAKNAPIQDYRTATGLEALCGYLYLDGRLERVVELLKAGLAGVKSGEGAK
ncbi:MAG: ribonuclease III [Lachnospiraceae bacterium]|nr:ribonuclease III [Lachnospiraceae bacterium]